MSTGEEPTSKTNSRCPVCASASIREFLFRGRVPVHQNLVIKDQESAAAFTRGDLDLVLCERCGFIFNRAFDMGKIEYGEEYDNTQSCSPSFDKYLDSLVRHLVLERGVRNCRIVEVGCGKGLFLRKLVEFEGAGNSGCGFDPSYIGEEVVLGGRMRFERRYYDADCADTPADVVVCRHVIEHVPAPLEMLGSIRNALKRSPDPRIFFETPCIEWILRNQIVWDFFYEHCSYFTAGSLTTAFQAAGFRVEQVRHVFAGQYLWLEATVADDNPPIVYNPGDLASLTSDYTGSESRIRSEWEERIRCLAAEGGVALWGAGAKGVTLANLVDPQRKLIKCVVDINPQKQGHYIPGTGHPIVGHGELEKFGVTVAILMNPNYRDETLALLQADNLNVRLI